MELHEAELFELAMAHHSLDGSVIFQYELVPVNSFNYGGDVKFHTKKQTSFTFPTVITEGKYGNQLERIRKFRVVLYSGSHEAGSTAKKVTSSDSAKSGPHIHIFFLSQGLRVRVEMGIKSDKVCVGVTLFCCRLFHLISLYMGH